MYIRNYTLVANWKMYFSYNQALNWCTTNKHDLLNLTSNIPFILCPSYESLTSLTEIFNKSTFVLGAQNCSEHSQGAYTGQIMAQSLQEIGVKYCIIGHSELRKAYNETNEQLLNKLKQLLMHDIIPIFCIGESREEHEQGLTLERLELQLQPLITVLQGHQKSITCFIAYEPIWAIGTGIVADNTHITDALNFIKKKLESEKTTHTFSLLYGGTVTSDTVTLLKKVEPLEGFLIGKASTNFQELKKIVSLVQES